MTRRTTQLRAQYATGGDRMSVVWFVTRPAPLDVLVRDATAELADLLVDHHLQATGITWVTVHGPDGGVWLRASLRVTAWNDPRRDQTRRSTTPTDH